MSTLTSFPLVSERDGSFLWLAPATGAWVLNLVRSYLRERPLFRLLFFFKIVPGQKWPFAQEQTQGWFFKRIFDFHVRGLSPLRFSLRGVPRGNFWPVSRPVPAALLSSCLFSSYHRVSYAAYPVSLFVSILASSELILVELFTLTCVCSFHTPNSTLTSFFLTCPHFPFFPPLSYPYISHFKSLYHTKV